MTLTDMRELIGQTQTGKMTVEELMAAEQTALPGVGTCSMLGTANTMSCLAEVLGLTLPRMGTSPAVSSEKRRLARASGKRIVAMVKEGITTQDILTRSALLDAVKAVQLPTVEVHLSDPDTREEFRKISYIRQACVATVKGLGFPGYAKALRLLRGAEG